jgi:hypothetical protein
MTHDEPVIPPIEDAALGRRVPLFTLRSKAEEIVHEGLSHWPRSHFTPFGTPE